MSKCKDCEFNDGDCGGRCAFDEEGFNPYEALMILMERSQDDKEDNGED